MILFSRSFRPLLRLPKAIGARSAVKSRRLGKRMSWESVTSLLMLANTLVLPYLLHIDEVRDRAEVHPELISAAQTKWR